jgi:hypothetical protein
MQTAVVTIRPLAWLPQWVPRWLRWPLGLLLSLPLLWATGAIAWGPFGLPGQQWVAWVFAVFTFVALWRLRARWPISVTAVLFVALLVVWGFIKPSHDREWRTDVSVMPQVVIDGDNVRISGYRNFDYRSRDDFTPHWETRELRLSDIRGVDFFISYWMQGPVAHTFLSFDVAGGEPVTVSIEARPESHEGYDPLPSLFRKFELIYVVGDERDIVRLRSNYRGEDVFMYHTTATPEMARALFRVYAGRINQLAAQPEFYNLVSNNCTLNIVRYANAVGRTGGWDIRHLINGWSDRYLYDTGLIDASMPFAQLRALSHINAAAVAAGDDPAFSRLVRQNRPVPVMVGEERPR